MEEAKVPVPALLLAAEVRRERARRLDKRITEREFHRTRIAPWSKRGDIFVNLGLEGWRRGRVLA